MSEFPTWPPNDPEIRASLLAVIEDGTWGQYHGRRVHKLEQKLAEFHGIAHALGQEKSDCVELLGLALIRPRKNPRSSTQSPFPFG